jgi:5'-3' exoribonuclease 1
LYGLDADLIMLGLVSHEPHFALLREEVTFGPKRNSSSSNGPQKFYLLHLSLLREYLNYEFCELEKQISFPYDFERILDDYVLLSYFVGNDFLPHLPGLHINEGGLTILFENYKKVLPQFNGYINENGRLDVKKCKILFSSLSELEMDQFETFQGDAAWLGSKSQTPKSSGASSLSLTESQAKIYMRIKTFVTDVVKEPEIVFNWSVLNETDRKFTLQLIKSLGLEHDLNTEDQEDTILIVSRYEEDEEESEIAMRRVLKKYDNAVDTLNTNIGSKTSEQIYTEKHQSWKDNYYRVF